MTTDQETRRRLLEVAARLFSKHGFKRVTVREICREAHANVAAVNYHFGDKLGLYTEVVRVAIDVIRGTRELSIQEAEGGTPEERLRAFIRVFLRRLVGQGRDSWIHNLMSREMADPTPALDLVVEEAIRPRLAYVGGIVAELMGCSTDDRRVTAVVASIQGQCLLYSPNPIATRLLGHWPPTDAELEQMATHIAEFSLAGIRAVS
ncbi:MAG: CerR family C-terminal domain-containing protein [Betaproteobacteria bacterium]